MPLSPASHPGRRCCGQPSCAGAGAPSATRRAAELDGLTDMTSPAVHVTVPTTQHIRGVTGADAAHRSATSWPLAILPTSSSDKDRGDHPRSHPDGSSPEEAFLGSPGMRKPPYHRQPSQMARASASRLGTGMSWRRVGGDGRGRAFHTGVPVYAGRRTAPWSATSPAAGEDQPGRTRRYLDNLYEEFGVAVELDGHVAHPVQDRLARCSPGQCPPGAGIITLRYNWTDITERALRSGRGDQRRSPAARMGGQPPSLRPALPRATPATLITGTFRRITPQTARDQEPIGGGGRG